MRAVESFETLSPLLGAQLRPGVATNVAFTREEYQREIQGGALFWEEAPGSLLLLRRRAGFYLVGFFLQRGAALPPVELPLPAVLEVAFRPRDKGLRQTLPQWEAQGFSPVFSRRRLLRPGGAPPAGGRRESLGRRGGGSALFRGGPKGLLRPLYRLPAQLPRASGGRPGRPGAAQHRGAFAHLPGGRGDPAAAPGGAAGVPPPGGGPGPFRPVHGAGGRPPQPLLGAGGQPARPPVLRKKRVRPRGMGLGGVPERMSAMNDREKIVKLLEEIVPGVDFEKESALVDDGVLESLDMVSVVTELMDAFDVEITVDDLLPENFNSVDAMLALIDRLR